VSEPVNEPVSDSAGPDACVGLDPDWVAAQLTVDGSSPDQVTFDGFIGTGQMSRNARFSVTWPKESAAGPTSVVTKVPSGEASTRAVSLQHGIYEKECEFYRTVSALVDVAVPDALAVFFDGDAGDFAIVLEDLAGSAQGDQFAEPSLEQLHLAVDQAVALQAPIWGATAGSSFDLYRRDPAERATTSAQMVPFFLNTVMDRLGPGLDDDVVEFLHRYSATAQLWAGAVTDPARETLVHGDFRPDNFMFGVEPSAPPLKVVDWQTLGLGLGVTDIAYLLGGALQPQSRHRLEGELLDRYVTGVTARGVDYSIEQCWDDYAFGALHGVGIALTATTMADVTERGDALFTLMLNRHGRHCLDLAILDRFDP
jgi:aminoglycoside/choline kinase family phosphotransferase